jgi:hypothetical protein
MDKPLMQVARAMVPNTLKESTLVAANPANHENPNWKHPAGLLSKMPDRDGVNRNDGVKHNDEQMNLSVQRSELIRQTEQWHNTTHVVQAHLFDDVNERRDVSVYDYLMSIGHEIISFKMCQRLFECWLSQKVEWHVERGLKLNIDGSPCLSGRSINVGQITGLPQAQKKALTKEAKMQTFCVSCFRSGTMTAHMASSGTQANKATFAHEVHHF